MARLDDSERTIWALTEQVDRLRARLAEVEAERDGWKMAAEHRGELHADALARLAEVEAERDNAVLLRDEWNARAGVAFARAEAAEVRIAHALRELREHRVAHAVAFLTGEHDDALRGEGDRPADLTPEQLAYMESFAWPASVWTPPADSGEGDRG